MKKLSASLRNLVRRGHADGLLLPKNLDRILFGPLLQKARAKDIGLSTAITLTTAAVTTLNAPVVLSLFHNWLNSKGTRESRLHSAELMREVCLKCVPFNGLPRTINALTSLHSTWAKDGLSLSNVQVRNTGLKSTVQDGVQGRRLWDSIYSGYSERLLSKLQDSHPDLPSTILSNHYPLLANSRSFKRKRLVGRVLTSVVAISCLRAQKGSSKQLESHVYGLQHAFREAVSSYSTQPNSPSVWLGSDAGCEWIITNVDKIIDFFENHKSGHALESFDTLASNSNPTSNLNDMGDALLSGSRALEDSNTLQSQEYEDDIEVLLRDVNETTLAGCFDEFDESERHSQANANTQE